MSDEQREPAAANGPWASRPLVPDQGRVREALARLTTLMAFATVGVVSFALVAPVETWLLYPRPVTAARRGIAHALREGGVAVGPPGGPREPRYDPDAFDPDEALHDHGDKIIPDEVLERYEREHERERAAEARGEGPRGPSPTREGAVATRRALSLLDRADDQGSFTARVPKGAKLKLVRLVGDWALVMATGEGNLVFGWTRRAELIEQ